MVSYRILTKTLSDFLLACRFTRLGGQAGSVFIGEETGGGFYGQTSGLYVSIVLPNTKMQIRMPLLKFATTFENNNIPFGRGVIPDHKIEQTFEEYKNGIDAQLEYTLNLIRSGK